MKLQMDLLDNGRIGIKTLKTKCLFVESKSENTLIQLTVTESQDYILKCVNLIFQFNLLKFNGFKQLQPMDKVHKLCIIVHIKIIID